MRGKARPRAVAVALWTAVALSALVALAHALSGLDERVELLGKFAAPALTVASTAALLAAAAGLARAAVAAAGVALALFAGQYGQWFPPAPPARDGAAPLVVYLANVGRHTTDLQPLAKSIRAAAPDVVVLVEADGRVRDRLRPLLPAYPHVADGSTPWDGGRGTRGRLVLSRYPLVKASEVTPDRATAAQRRVILARELAPGNVGAADASVLAPQGRLRILAVQVHRPWPFAAPGYHAEQIDSVVASVRRGRQAETLLLGDFNAPPAARNLRRLARETGLRPAPAPLGTWPAVLPAPLRISLDNAFAGSDWTIVSRSLGRPTASDHQPVVLVLKPAVPTRNQEASRISAGAS